MENRVKSQKIISCIVLSIIMSFCVPALVHANDYAIGADLSFLKQAETNLSNSSPE